jgi:hypothetical protein
MDTLTAASRQLSFRAIGWLAITALLALAILGPAAGGALANHTIDVQDTALGNGFDDPCGDADALKINSGEIVDGTHTYNFGGGVTIVLTPTFNEGTTGAIDSVAVGAVSGGSFDSIYVHAGEGTTLQVVEGLIVDPPKDVSFILFCVGESTTTTTTTTAATTTTTAATTTTTAATTTTTAATTTTGTVSATTSVNTTTTGSVSGTTGTGTITLPPTSTVDPDSGSNSTLISFGLLLLAVGGLVLGLARPLATRKVDDR